MFWRSCSFASIYLLLLPQPFIAVSGFLAIVTFNSYGSNMARIWCNTNPTPAFLVTPPNRVTPSTWGPPASRP